MSASAPHTSVISWWAPSSLPVFTTPATRLYATGRPSSVSASIASIRSITRWAIEDGLPTQVGVAITRISDARILDRIAGQASRDPCRTRRRA